MSEEWRTFLPVALCFFEIQWERTGDGEFPYQTVVDGQHCMIRVNDFPADPLYTLMIDGKAALDLEDWPSVWLRPPVPKDSD